MLRRVHVYICRSLDANEEILDVNADASFPDADPHAI